MNEKRKSLTLDGMSGAHFLLIFLAVGMIATGIYLTNHYFDIKFSLDLTGGKALCDISSFWNCDVATHSPLADILGVPTGVFGILIGLFILAGSLFPSEEFEQTNKFFVTVNLVGCLALFTYSLISMGSLCPGCTIYYALSGVVFFLYYKYGIKPYFPDIKIAIGYTLTIVVVGGIFSFYVQQQKNKYHRYSERLKKELIPRFYALENLGPPPEVSEFKIIESTAQFSEAPIRMTVFSDFQCPYCAKLVGILNNLKKKYTGHLNIDYNFYPIDSACNPAVKAPMHPLACKASYIAICAKDHFNTIHDEIFENQKNLSDKWLDEYAEKYQVKDCIESEMPKERIKRMSKVAEKYKVQSTPMTIINGRRIEGILRITDYYVIFDELISKAKK